MLGYRSVTPGILLFASAKHGQILKGPLWRNGTRVLSGLSFTGQFMLGMYLKRQLD